MAKRRITDVAGEILEEYLPENGYSLYHSEFVKEGRDWFLRIFVDKDSGPMGTDDCETISRYLSDKLDEKDPVEKNYYLVVSSPGIDRELVTEEHYKMFIGHDVDVNLYKALDGEKTVSGTLTGFEDDILCLDTDKGTIKLPRKEISKTRLAVKF